MEMCPDCFGKNMADGICANCGFNLNEYVWEDYQLPLFTVIGGKYIIGRVIGEGGFGITYTAYNSELNTKYAVKEYYPAEISGRGYSSPDGMTIYPFSGNKKEFDKGLERFEREALQLAQFDGMEGVVNVKDYIAENGTGYIFMEFVSGKSLEAYLSEHGGKISFDEAANILKPVIAALSRVHHKKIIHRDISPDNIILTENHGPMLIDFGASRQYDTDKSISVILKYGYAPYEQYSRHGEQGPWTDIYALCATFYRMISGKKPPDSVVRIQDSAELVPLSELCSDIPPECEAVIMKGLAVKKQDRLQSMDELYDVLYGNKGKNSKSKSLWAAYFAAALLIVGTIVMYNISDKDDLEVTVQYTSMTKNITAADDTEPSLDAYIPTVIYGLPSCEDEPYIKGRLVIDLDNTDKAAADDPTELYDPQTKSSAITIMGAPKNTNTQSVVYLAPEITSLSDYVQTHGWRFETYKPVYSFIKEDMDRDGENEYYICVMLSLNTSETAYLLYYKDSDGSIELICNGKLSDSAKGCESILEHDAEIIYQSGEKHLTADISDDNSRYIILNRNTYSLLDDNDTNEQ
ncbi:MAG: serine/threonine protein kinase [Oscillospiraceae bacterium]